MLAKSFVFSMISMCLCQFAIASDKITPNNLRSEIATKLQDISVQNLDDVSQVVIKFIIDEDNKLVVLGSNNKEIQPRIEYHLNNKTIIAEDAKINQVYNIPITIKKK